MKKLSEDELLVMASEKMEMDLLEKPCPYHKFSRDYESRRKVLCDQVRRPDKHLKYWSFPSAGRKWTAAAAVLVMVSAVSVTAYAYYRNLVMNAKQDENYVSVELSESVAAEEDMEHSLENLPEQGIEVPKVNLAVGYVPEGFMAVAGLVMLRRGKKLDGAKWFGKVCTFVFYLVTVTLILWVSIPPTVADILIAVCGAVMAFTLAMYIPVFVKMNREAKADAGEK